MTFKADFFHFSIDSQIKHLLLYDYDNQKKNII